MHNDPTAVFGLAIAFLGLMVTVLSFYFGADESHAVARKLAATIVGTASVLIGALAFNVLFLGPAPAPAPQLLATPVPPTVAAAISATPVLVSQLVSTLTSTPTQTPIDTPTLPPATPTPTPSPDLPTPVPPTAALPPPAASDTPTALPSRTPTATASLSQPQQTATAAYATVQAMQSLPEWTATPTQDPVSAATATAVVRVAQAVPTIEALGIGGNNPYVDPVTGAIFTFVPAGEFLMGSTESDIDYAMKLCGEGWNPGGCTRSDFEPETPQHKVLLDGYWIMVTEVTRQQYLQFMDDGGYREQRYWTEAGWNWFNGRKLTSPQGQRWTYRGYANPNFPAGGISWWEAVAYTRWLAERTGLPMRLPTEAEWEKACRGVDGRLFPWGNDEPTYDKEATLEMGVIGQHPQGASPYGAQDMIGSVYEWVSTSWSSPTMEPKYWYPYIPGDGREVLEGSDVRILRGWAGGAFARDHMRCAFRRGAPASPYDSSVSGVRVVFSLPTGAKP